MKVDGQRIAIIGATQVLDDHLITEWTAGPGKIGLASAKDEPRLLRAVREARETSDTVVVFLHWGLELATCPTGAQTSLARALVGAGADVVVGSHAHVLQGAGRMNRALVAYGLGNFVFYAFRELTSQTGVLEVTVTGRRIDGYRWVPARISGGIPYSVDGRRTVAGARELARAPRVHGPPALTPRRRDAAAESPGPCRLQISYGAGATVAACDSEPQSSPCSSPPPSPARRRRTREARFP